MRSTLRYTLLTNLFMKRSILLSLAVLSATVGFAQSFYHEEPMYVRPSRRVYLQEIGIRYEMQPAVEYSHRDGPTLQHIVVEYARYNTRNLGFRSGLKVGITPNSSTSFAVPMHFSFRSGRIDPLYKTTSPSVDFYNGKYYVRESDRMNYRTMDSFGEAVSSAALQTAGSMLPFVFELHAGLTPGYLTGNRVDNYYAIKHHFHCTADFGLRFVIPVWRMGIVLDGAFNYLLTDNYISVAEQSISRFYATGSVGLVYRF